MAGRATTAVASVDIGTVALVRMGDPEAVTAESDQPRDEELIEEPADAFESGDEPDLPPILQARLVRSGFITIDSKSLVGPDR